MIICSSVKVEQNDADEAFSMRREPFPGKTTNILGALAILMEYSTLNQVTVQRKVIKKILDMDI